MASSKPDKQPVEQLEKVPPQIHLAEQLRLKGDLKEALKVTEKFLGENYEHVPALVMAAHIHADAKKLGIAQALLKLATMLRPDSSLVWSDLGFCYQEGQDLKEGERCFVKALQRNPNNAMALNNLSQLYVNTAQPMKAINCADKAIRLDPSLPDSHYNRGLAMLQLGNWEEGWKGYEYNLGKHKGRKERTYGIIPRWTGVKGLTLIAYGEQGIGDEISFASCLPDLAKENNVIVECDSRLLGLFSRSFPECLVYGTRYQEGIEWPHKHEIDASVAFGSLPGFYRKKDEDFPGTPYLKADPQRRLMYRALLDSLGPKKKIGIAWAGGRKDTGAARRSMLLYDLAPVLRQDATFISLNYRDAEETVLVEENHGLKVHHWPFATMTKDYDDTAALVAELDLVITVTQAVVHLAGGLGVPCWVMVPKEPMWRYRLNGPDFLWAKSVKLYRQRNEWVHIVAEVASDLRKWLNGGHQSHAAAEKGDTKAGGSGKDIARQAASGSPRAQEAARQNETRPAPAEASIPGDALEGAEMGAGEPAEGEGSEITLGAREPGEDQRSSAPL